MDTITRTFPLKIDNTYTANTVLELFHLRDMVFDADERIGVYLEAWFCNLNLKSFQPGIIPEFEGDESEREKMSKFTAAENRSQKIGIQILERKNNVGDWDEVAEIILVNRERKDYFDLLQPYLTKNPVRIVEKNDSFGIKLIDYGNGFLKVGDKIKVTLGVSITVAKKNNMDIFNSRLAALELAIDGRLTNIAPNHFLGREVTSGVVNQIPFTRFATQANIDQAIIDWVGTAPLNLDTLKEFAAAINNDANFAATVTTALGTKAPLTNSLLLTNRSSQTGAFNANTWALNHFAGIKWIDGAGGANTNLPVQTGMLFQFDCLFGTTDATKYRVQHFYSGSRYFLRVESNANWGAWREISTTVVT